MRPDGFYDDIPEADYHGDRESLSVSGAKTLLKTPALFKWQQDNPVHKDVFDMGTAAHALVLGIGDPLYVVMAEDWRTNAAKAERDGAREHGMTPLLEADYLTVCAMADKLSEHTLAMRLLSDGKPEVSGYALDKPTGVQRRGRFDWLGDGWICDYKTAQSAEPGHFAASAARFGYAMQAAWYLDLARDLGREVDGFVFIVQEKEAPYLVSVCELDWASEQVGRVRNRRALDLFARCKAEGSWPGYGAGLHTISLPKWALNEEEFTA